MQTQKANNAYGIYYSPQPDNFPKRVREARVSRICYHNGYSEKRYMPLSRSAVYLNEHLIKSINPDTKKKLMTITLSDEALMSEFNVSRRTIQRARRELIEANLWEMHRVKNGLEKKSCGYYRFTAVIEETINDQKQKETTQKAESQRKEWLTRQDSEKNEHESNQKKSDLSSKNDNVCRGSMTKDDTKKRQTLSQESTHESYEKSDDTRVSESQEASPIASGFKDLDVDTSSSSSSQGNSINSKNFANNEQKEKEGYQINLEQKKNPTSHTSETSQGKSADERTEETSSEKTVPPEPMITPTTPTIQPPPNPSSFDLSTLSSTNPHIQPQTQAQTLQTDDETPSHHVSPDTNILVAAKGLCKAWKEKRGNWEHTPEAFVQCIQVVQARFEVEVDEAGRIIEAAIQRAIGSDIGGDHPNWFIKHSEGKDEIKKAKRWLEMPRDGEGLVVELTEKEKGDTISKLRGQVRETLTHEEQQTEARKYQRYIKTASSADHAVMVMKRKDDRISQDVTVALWEELSAKEQVINAAVRKADEDERRDRIVEMMERGRKDEEKSEARNSGYHEGNVPDSAFRDISGDTGGI